VSDVCAVAEKTSTKELLSINRECAQVTLHPSERAINNNNCMFPLGARSLFFSISIGGTSDRLQKQLTMSSMGHPQSSTTNLAHSEADDAKCIVGF